MQEHHTASDPNRILENPERADMNSTAARAIQAHAEKLAAADFARREAQIRAELIEEVRDAIKAESERIGQEIGYSGDLDTAFATVAVDALADYYRRAQRPIGGLR